MKKAALKERPKSVGETSTGSRLFRPTVCSDGATLEDAEELARYERLAPKINTFMDYVGQAIA